MGTGEGIKTVNSKQGKCRLETKITQRLRTERSLKDKVVKTNGFWHGLEVQQ